jgi:hypothetical protein
LTMFYLKVLHILRPSKQILVEIWISIHCLILNLMITKANEFGMWLNKFCGYLYTAWFTILNVARLYPSDKQTNCSLQGHLLHHR